MLGREAASWRRAKWILKEREPFHHHPLPQTQTEPGARAQLPVESEHREDGAVSTWAVALLTGQGGALATGAAGLGTVRLMISSHCS